MSEKDEQPRLSLRLRKTPDRPPETPKSEEPPKTPEPEQPKESAGDAAPRLRLSAMIKPASGDSAPATPPSPSEPPPAPPSPPPVAVEPPAPAAAPEPPPQAASEVSPKVEPEPPAAPRPEPAAPPAPPPPPAPAPAPEPFAHVPERAPVEPPKVDANLPVVEPPRPLQFPQEEETEEKKGTPKPPSARTVGLAMLAVIILAIGGIAYLFFADPFGLFKEPEPVAAAKPAAQPSAQPAAPPAAATPAPQPPPVSTSVAATSPEPAESEFKMPAPAPLDDGEEIAPGVVRLPRDASGVSTPASRPYEPPEPKQNPAYVSLVNNLNITGIRENSSGGFLMVNGVLFRPGDIVDQQSKLVFMSIDGPTITFKDPYGALYSRRF